MSRFEDIILTSIIWLQYIAIFNLYVSEFFEPNLIYNFMEYLIIYVLFFKGGEVYPDNISGCGFSNKMNK